MNMRRLAVLATLIALSSFSLGSVAIAQDEGGGGGGQDSPPAVDAASEQQVPDASSAEEVPDAAACAANPALKGCVGTFAAALSRPNNDNQVIALTDPAFRKLSR
jgi:hypothetical protein